MILLPCYEVNTMCQRFTAKSRDLLVKALADLGYTVRETADVLYVNARGLREPLTMDLRRETVSFNQMDARAVNEIRRRYSYRVIEAAAAKQRWGLRVKEKDRKFVAVRVG